jgi:hypothetical protein
MVVPKRKTPVITVLDPIMVSLVEALNSFKAITTVGSCGGHADPGPAQKPLGEWSVAFKLAADEHGWRTLEFLAWLVNNDARRGGSKVRLEPFSAPPYMNTPGECLVFHLTGSGGEDPWAGIAGDGKDSPLFRAGNGSGDIIHNYRQDFECLVVWGHGPFSTSCRPWFSPSYHSAGKPPAADVFL